METDPSHKIIAPVYPVRTSSVEKAAEKTFGVILEEFIDNTSEIDRDKKIPSTDGISAIGSNFFLPKGEMAVVSHAERLLDMLDLYQQRLSSTEFTLRDISPLVSEMEAENKTLGAAVNSLSDGDKLKDVLNHIIITSSVEIIKFNRGDYVNS